MEFLLFLVISIMTKESWAQKDWCFWTVVLEKTLEGPLGCKEIRSVCPKGDQCWMFIVRTDVEAETPILWPPHVKSWLIWKDPDVGKDWRQEKKGATEDEMVGWHHWLSVHEFEQALGDGDGQGGLACCSSWDHKELDMTKWLNWTELIMMKISVQILLEQTTYCHLHFKFEIEQRILCKTASQVSCRSKTKDYTIPKPVLFLITKMSWHSGREEGLAWKIHTTFIDNVRIGQIEMILLGVIS